MKSISKKRFLKIALLFIPFLDALAGDDLRALTEGSWTLSKSGSETIQLLGPESPTLVIERLGKPMFSQSKTYCRFRYTAEIQEKEICPDKSCDSIRYQFVRRKVELVPSITQSAGCEQSLQIEQTALLTLQQFEEMWVKKTDRPDCLEIQWTRDKREYTTVPYCSVVPVVDPNPLKAIAENAAIWPFVQDLIAPGSQGCSDPAKLANRKVCAGISPNVHYPDPCENPIMRKVPELALQKLEDWTVANMSGSFPASTQPAAALKALSIYPMFAVDLALLMDDQKWVRSINRELVKQCVNHTRLKKGEELLVKYQNQDICFGGCQSDQRAKIIKIIHTSPVKYTLTLNSTARMGEPPVKAAIHYSVRTRPFSLNQEKKQAILFKIRSCVPDIRELFARSGIALDLQFELAGQVFGQGWIPIVAVEKAGRSNASKIYLLGQKEPCYRTAQSACKTAQDLENCMSEQFVACAEKKRTEFCGMLSHEVSHGFGLPDEYRDPNCPDRLYQASNSVPQSPMRHSEKVLDEHDLYPRHVSQILAPMCPK